MRALPDVGPAFKGWKRTSGITRDRIILILRAVHERIMENRRPWDINAFGMNCSRHSAGNGKGIPCAEGDWQVERAVGSISAKSASESVFSVYCLGSMAFKVRHSRYPPITITS